MPPGLLRLAERTGRVELRGLDVGAVTELAEAGLGRPVRRAAAERLRAHTGGNPLHIRALLGELGDQAVTASGALPTPRSYTSLVLAKVASCTAAAERMLVALAALGDGASLADVALVAEVDEPLPAADELGGRGLAEIAAGPGGPVLAFPHALVRASVYDDQSPSRRARTHAAAAEVTSGEDALRHRLGGGGPP